MNMPLFGIQRREKLPCLPSGDLRCHQSFFCLNVAIYKGKPGINIRGNFPHIQNAILFMYQSSHDFFDTVRAILREPPEDLL